MRIPNFPVRYLPLSLFGLCLVGLIVLYIVDPDVPQKPATAPLPIPPVTGPQEPSVPVKGLQELDTGPQPVVAPPPIVVEPKPAVADESEARTVESGAAVPEATVPATPCYRRCRPWWRRCR